MAMLTYVKVCVHARVCVYTFKLSSMLVIYLLVTVNESLRMTHFTSFIFALICQLYSRTLSLFLCLSALLPHPTPKMPVALI